jgi:hypothetical protein
MMEKTVGVSYGRWWAAPYPFRDFAYYQCLRRIYELPAAEALSKVRSFPGGASNLMQNLRDAINS